MLTKIILASIFIVALANATTFGTERQEGDELLFSTLYQTAVTSVPTIHVLSPFWDGHLTNQSYTQVIFEASSMDYIGNLWQITEANNMTTQFISQFFYFDLYQLTIGLTVYGFNDVVPANNKQATPVYHLTTEDTSKH